MRRTRALLTAAAAGILALGATAGPAAAAGTTGVGTSTVSATALTVRLGPNGDLLTIRVLGDDGTATIDPARGTPAAGTNLRPLVISSKTVPALNVTTPPIATASKGSEDKKSVEPALPSSPAFAGSLNAVVSSLVDAAGARSGLQAGLANLRLAGGLVNVPTGVVQLASSAAQGSTSGSRSITIPEVRVLDLAAVLEALGLDLTDLSVEQLLGLLGGLGITLPGIADPAAAVAALNQAIDTLQAATGPLTAQLCGTVDGLLQGPLGGVTGLVGGVVSGLPQVVGGVTGSLPALPSTPVTPGGSVTLPPVVGGVLGGLGLSSAALPAGFSCSNLTGTVQDLLTEVRGTLGKLLAGALAELGSVPLLSVKDVKVGLVATAAQDVASSVADVTASIGEVRVGKLPVPGVGALDLTAPAAVLGQASSTVEAAIGNLLKPLNASLANLVDVDLLAIQEKVEAIAGGYTQARSSVTAVTATITPPTALGAALLDLKATPVTSVLGTVGTAVPAIAPVMGQLEAALGGLDALSAPATVTIGELAGEAQFRPVSAASVPGGVTSSPGGTLPRTGGAAFPAMAAVLLGGAGLAIRRILRSAA